MRGGIHTSAPTQRNCYARRPVLCLAAAAGDAGHPAEPFRQPLLPAAEPSGNFASSKHHAHAAATAAAAFTNTSFRPHHLPALPSQAQPIHPPAWPTSPWGVHYPRSSAYLLTTSTSTNCSCPAGRTPQDLTHSQWAHLSAAAGPPSRPATPVSQPQLQQGPCCTDNITCLGSPWAPDQGHQPL
jgi:hypothetical protein